MGFSVGATEGKPVGAELKVGKGEGAIDALGFGVGFSVGTGVGLRVVGEGVGFAGVCASSP